MAKSLQDQLLKAGLVTDQQTKKLKSEKRKQTKLQHKNNVQVENKNLSAVQKSQADKTLKDRQLNQQRQQQANIKAVKAELRQLIKLNSQPIDDQGEAYHFQEAGMIKTIYVTESQRQQIIQGKLVIVKFGKKYHLVVMEIAEKIRQRDANSIILIIDIKSDAPAEDDTYADFQVPDDLIW
jgi:uncharacterized protein YaiL (DUF2058 family)